MLKLSRNLINNISLNNFSQYIKCNAQSRNVSALYMSGDKASENYVTLQPYTDFSGTFGNLEALELSIQKRKLNINLNEVKQMYDMYHKTQTKIENLEDEREMVAKQLKEMIKSKEKDEDLINQLKEKGKHLRNEVKREKHDFYPVEDEFMQSFLNLPNLLHPQCPDGDFDRTLYRSRLVEDKGAKSHLSYENLIAFIDNSRYYMMSEAAEFDIYATDALTTYFLRKGGFIQTSNPDFVRLVLLEANATPLQHYHKVMETQLENAVNCAYLTGGASFESYLGAVTKLCVYPSVIPLKYVCNGRLYEKSMDEFTPSLYTATQTNAVQTFVASRDQQQAEEQMDDILNLCVDFYKSFTDLHFQVVYVKASELTASESLRAQIEVYSPKEKRYICVGRVSNYSDYVSKRILFTMREQKNYNFLHLVGGPVLYTSRLIAALIENEVPLDYTKLLQSLKLDNSKENSGDTINAMDEFKSLFK